LLLGPIWSGSCGRATGRDPASISAARFIGEPMSRRPANFTQADIARAIRAAKQEGAPEIEVRIGAASIVVRLYPVPNVPNEVGAHIAALSF
jgi:hypothetical protein